jgi:hypothetical protein
MLSKILGYHMSNCRNVFQPIFIVGNSRSGTTLMAKILKNNSSIHVFNELHYFEQIWSIDDIDSLKEQNAKEIYAKLQRNIKEGIFSSTPWTRYLPSDIGVINSKENKITGYDIYSYVITNEIKKYDKCRPCEQTPRYVYYLDELLNEYNDAHAIVMIRDPRAILLSQKKKWKQKTIERNGKAYSKAERIRRWANYHPIVTSFLWRSAIRAGLRSESHPRVITVQFEKLVLEQTSTIQRVCDFMGVDYTDDMLDVEPTFSPTGNINAKESLKKGIDPKIADRWKRDLSDIDMYFCEWINKDYMEKLGYERTGVRPSIMLLLASLVSLPLKLFLAFVLNLRNVNNVFKSISKRFS